MTTPRHDILPPGWIQQFDERTQHPFWVDTKAKPPRSIWVHPYEDEQFLNEHPDIRENLRQMAPSPGGDEPPPYSPPRRHSYAGEAQAGPSRSQDARASASHPSTPDPSTQGHAERKKHDEKAKRGFFGKLKDKAIGTKEEREEAKKRQAELERQWAEQRQQQQLQMAEQYNRMGVGRGPFSQQGMYGAPAGFPGAYGYGQGRSRFGGGGMGGMGMGLPLVGGLAGGLLLGEMLDGPGYGYGGDWGGGGFGDNDFGGGW